MTAHVFGDLSSPSCSNFTLKKTAAENVKKYGTSYVKALSRRISIYLTNLLGMFDILTQQEIATGKPYVCQSYCLNITISYC